MNGNTHFYRHECEKRQAKEIEGQKKQNKATLWPAIKVTNPPSCSADVFIQLVECKEEE